MMGVGLFFFFSCGSAVLAANEISDPKDAIFIPLKVYQCDNFTPVVPLDVNLHDDGVDVEFELEEEFTDLYQATVRISVWEDGAWKITNNDGRPGVCETLSKSFGKAWSRARAGFTPAMPGTCSIKPGHYKITNFKMSNEDVDLPITNTGKYQAKIVISDEYDTEITCVMVDVEIAKK
ncbi:uncharacterized protein LOC108907421 [Anoplophora glabripennis]|uniref:uncharacterized protein LOC108907421 n=1 Tax=Anoplophora glabripennis TaxID=217634 RepID=UPI000874039C|nr:uncharacterized protein LOC108907421 [Anoplophora glabripennis]